MEENSLASASFPLLVSLVIAGASVLGALALQVGGNVLSDEIFMRWRLNRRRVLKAQRLAYGLRLAKGRRQRVRRLMGRRPVLPKPACADQPKPGGAARPPQADPAPSPGPDAPMEVRLAHAEALAERELSKLIALCAPEFEGRAFAFGEAPLDAHCRRAQVIDAMQRRAAALLRRGQGRCRA